MFIGVPAETAAGETRVAVTPETVKKLKAQGHEIAVQSGAGVAASVTDEAYVAAGATITDGAGALVRLGAQGAGALGGRVAHAQARKHLGGHAQSL